MGFTELEIANRQTHSYSFRHSRLRLIKGNRSDEQEINRCYFRSDRCTAVPEERNGHWQIVHWHASAPRRAPAPSATPKTCEEA